LSLEPSIRKQRELGRPVWQIEILAAVDHEDRLRGASGGVHRIDFRRQRPRLEAAGEQDAGPESRLDGERTRRELRAEAQPVERDPRAVDVGPSDPGKKITA